MAAALARRGTHRRTATALALASGLALSAVAVVVPAPAGADGHSLERLEGPGDVPANTNVELDDLSADGSRLVVTSTATNLYAGAPAAANVLSWDRGTDVIGLLSRTDGGLPYGGGCFDGDSAVAGLVTLLRCVDPGPAGAPPVDDTHAYVADQGGVELVSLVDGASPEDPDVPVAGGAAEAHISESGGLVAFEGVVSDQVYLRDLGDEETIVASRTPAGQPANGESHLIDIDDGGTAVLFYSWATNLDGSTLPGLFVYDVATQDVERISVASDGDPAAAGTTLEASISAGGRYVAFGSGSNDLVDGDTGGIDVFVRDRLAGTTEIVSVTPAGLPAGGTSDDPDISDDGRFVAFTSSADDILDAVSDRQAYRYDRATDTTVRVSEGPDGVQGDDISRNPRISADGDVVAFEFLGTNLIGGGDDDELVVWDAPGGPACTLDFTDVPASHPFHADICWAVAEGIVAGYSDGTFKPAAPVSRQALVVFLWRLFDEPAGPYPPSGLSDEPAADPFRAAVRWAVAEGVVGGYQDGTFRPTVAVSRQAFVVFLWRLAGEPSGPFAPSGLTDVPAGEPFRTAIEWGAANGIVNGYDDGTFRGTFPVSRQAAVAFLNRWWP